ncbi:MAG: phosphatidate cytidylyltransferase [Prevotellaceae bacterium]|jgi:phosphatidate cytidylyltransferase|nr:phosphatidate cytidylyltransferase [Prevotellaceae bacterium]
MKTLIIRTLSGAVYVALIVSAILINQFFFAAVFGILAALTTYEFHKLTNKQVNVDALARLSAIASLLFFVQFFILNIAYDPYKFINADLIEKVLTIIYLFTLFSIFIIEIFRKKTNPINNIACFILGQLYIAVPFAVSVTIFNKNPLFLLALFVIIWVNDTFAYLVGSWLGKHRMCERISPKKSWEGFFGGLFGALLAGFVFSKFVVDLSLIKWLAFAIIIVVFGTLGDLFESLIKRTVGVKDSGNIMPGHGGFLDRLDSVIFSVIPIAVYLAIII